MKRLIISILVLWAPLMLSAGNSVKLSIVDGISDGAIKKAIEVNASALLSEINASQEAKRPLSFYNLKVSQEAQESISMLWENVPFFCEDEVIYERVITTGEGYQIRNIPIELTPIDCTLSDDAYQEAVINFDSNGTIQGFYFGLSNVLWKQVMNGDDVGDLRKRQMILDYVEHFRTSYNQKDIEFLDQVFSDDALIITGKVVKRKPTDFNPLSQDVITYNMRTKKEYLSRLKNIFSITKYVKVSFSEIKITRHPTKPEFYGVLLKQGYDSSTYSDEGYLFLLWDFRDEDTPQIHVRTWQPYYLNEEKTSTISDKEIFDISSFDF